MNYRPEIDGLRSVAVLPVILFHAGFSIFSGGYIGVDVFFVISGYLITTILISEREAGTYSLLGFYERRARRILPALFVVLLCTIPFAWRWIPPDPFEDYARSLAYAAMFISNIHFLEKSSYFDIGAEFRPLLHTWSLAVEEQYYLLFPLVLWALGHFVRLKFLIVFLILSALSLGLAEWGWRNFPTENFFFSPSRLWELLAGSICAVLLFRRAQYRNEIGAMVGLLLIMGSVFYYDNTVPFPSIYTLPPVLGCVLIILFAAQGTWVARLLSLRPLVAIGLISYSAYLWHQPLFVFARIRSIAEPSALLMGGLALASLLLAWLTWRFVETPFRRRRALGGRGPLLSASLAGIVALAAFGLWGDATKGVPGRVSAKQSAQQAQWYDQIRSTRPQDNCPDKQKEIAGKLCSTYQPESAAGKIALVGDSHAQSILPAFERVAHDHGVEILRGVRAACPPLLKVFLASGGYNAALCSVHATEFAQDLVAQGAETVFIAARWSLYAGDTYERETDRFALTQEAGENAPSLEERRAAFEAGLEATVSFYREAGLRVVLIAQVPQQWVMPENILLQAMLQGLDDEESREKFRASFIHRTYHDDLVRYADSVLARMARDYGAEVLTLTDHFAEGDRYAWFRDDKVLYRDRDHLSTEGALSLGPWISRAYGGE